MIIFYNKKTGEIFATIDGRVHNKEQTKCTIDNGIDKESVGKYIIGFEETDEQEEYKEEVDNMIEIEKDIFKKVKSVVRLKRNKKIEHNLDKFELLQKFEDNTIENPMDYKIINNNLIKK